MDGRYCCLAVQTFLPYPSFARSAAVLDSRRLGKQRVEALQILRALHLEGYGWANHPAVLMWRGYTRALVAYGLAVAYEWQERGHADTTRDNIAEFARPAPALVESRLPAGERPPWLGWSALHRSHQAALMRKDAAAYESAFPGVRIDHPYIWPEPLHDRLPEQPFTAWVVRAPTKETLTRFREHGFVGVPAALGAEDAKPKQRRQWRRWQDEPRVGHWVVVPDGDELRCGRIEGEPTGRDLAGSPFMTRAVRWEQVVPRSALSRPFQLQDPQTVFALRGERSPEVDVSQRLEHQ